MQNNQHRTQWLTRCKDSSPQRASKQLCKWHEPRVPYSESLMTLSSRREKLLSSELVLQDCPSPIVMANTNSRLFANMSCPIIYTLGLPQYTPPFTLTNLPAWLAGLRKTRLPVYWKGHHRDHSGGICRTRERNGDNPFLELWVTSCLEVLWTLHFGFLWRPQNIDITD